MANSKDNKPIYASQKQLYEKAVQKMNADRVIVQHAYKIDNYKIAAAMFDEVGDYLDAKEMAQRCRDLIEETKEDEKAVAYQRCVDRMKDSSTFEDIEKVKKLEGQLQALPGYKDADKLREKCTAHINRVQRKGRFKTRTTLGILLALVVLAGIGIHTGYLKYMAGVAIMKYGKYGYAEKIFRSMPGYRDADEYVQRNEIRKLLKAEVDTQVRFGDFKWLILEADEKELLMMAVQGSSYGTSGQPFDAELKETSWKDCSLREWLNTEVYENAFSDAERECIIPQTLTGSANADYQTAYEEETQDYITLLSMEEMDKYLPSLQSMSVDFWLRTPGHAMDTAAFFDGASHTVKSYGYPVNEAITMRPVIRLDREKLATV